MLLESPAGIRVVERYDGGVTAEHDARTHLANPRWVLKRSPLRLPARESGTVARMYRLTDPASGAWVMTKGRTR